MLSNFDAIEEIDGAAQKNVLRPEFLANPKGAKPLQRQKPSASESRKETGPEEDALGLQQHHAEENAYPSIGLHSKGMDVVERAPLLFEGNKAKQRPLLSWDRRHANRMRS